ncbi:MAG TPA: hypothetical protein PKK06_16800 [Phycisphaerae bacterium]|nr:hypothetical protein [Phycisphaerae bacterium]HNU46847.1 hypothetical protein [Phycisphaerae bacterium]
MMEQLDRKAIAERIRTTAQRRWPRRAWLRSFSKATGIPHAALAMHTTGVRIPKLLSLIRIARVLRRSVDWILTGRSGRG